MISLIHPSRGRPEKALSTALDWFLKFQPHDKWLIELEYILSIDSDDKSVYRQPIMKSVSTKVITNNNGSLVEATNQAAKEAKGDILVYLSDDFKCPENWGQLILKEFEGVTSPMLLKVDDCLQKFYVPVLTIPIMNRALYNLLGYFFHPDFQSMHCDEHLYQRCLRLGVIKKTPHLKFEHWHVSNGKAENDETYRRSAANWDQGKQMMRKHRRLGFTQ